MAAPQPSLSGGNIDDFYNRVAIVRSSDNRVIDIVMSGGAVFTDIYGVAVISVPVNVGESCEIYWLYDQFNVGARFYSDGANYEESLVTPTTVFPGSIAVGNNPPISNRGYHIQFPDGTTQDSAVNRTRLTTFTALQEFAAGISSGQILTVDPIDGAGLIAVKALSGGNTRIGAVRLGYAPTPTYNTFLENSSGTFTIYNGFSATGSNLLNISTTKMVVNVPVDGIDFRTGITAPNIVYSINGCTGTLGITGTVNEIEVTGPCPNIVIGLPDNVTVAGILQAAGLSATTATFGNIYAPNIVTSINGRTGAITGLTASQILVGSSNVNGTRYITFVGGSGNTSIFIDDVTTPLTYNPVQGNIGAKKVVLTTTSNVLTLDSASPNIVLTDGANISTFGLDSFAASYINPFVISNTLGISFQANTIAFETGTGTYVFPTTNGSNGQVLTTNGAGTLSWTTVSGGGGSSTGFTYTSSAPSSPSVGDRWIDSDTGKEYVYVNDGSSSQWIEPVSSNGLVGVTYTSNIQLLEFGVTGSFVKLGIGTTAPNYPLDVNGTANFRSGISAAGITVNGNANITGSLNGAGATFTGAVISDGGYRISSNAINAQTGTTYTLLTSDNGKIITMNNGSSSTVTIPSGLPVGYNTTVVQLGTGSVGFTSSGTTINSAEGKLNLAFRYSAANIISYTSNTFVVAGGMTG